MKNDVLHRKIKRVFIANRGEIARRIALTSKKLGYETATLRQSGSTELFLKDLIDVYIDVENLSREHYLSVEMMCAFAKEAKADAVHPGFGFLSESAEFAEAVIATGIIWIGPNPASIQAMASKEGAKNVARKAGVPINEGVSGILFESTEFNLKQCEDACEKLGFPVLVKAAFGGGGKGMRRVENKAELQAALERCTSEAKRSFGNPLLIIEKYLLNPRHVEVQVLADNHGNTIAVGDRDCSIQRRHQKIIEEAPAPNIDPNVRKSMHLAAIKLAKIVNYTSAGTVEFMLTEANGKQDFYFLEMNTRLQVEHPVTEEVFGTDLVEQQLRIAEGLTIENHLLSENLEPSGHAIEVRVYGENVQKDFLPTAGKVDYFNPCLKEARWEIGLDPSGHVTSEFDPMIAKVITKGSTRLEAIDKMVRVLKATHLFGIESNIEFLIAIMEESQFRLAHLSTAYLSAAKVTQLLTDMEQKRKVLIPLQRDLANFAIGTMKSLSSRPEDIFYRWFLPRLNPSLRLVSSPRLHHCANLSCLEVETGSGFGPSKKFVIYVSARQVYIHSEGSQVVHRRLADFEGDILSQSQGKVGSSLAPVPGKVIRIHLKNGAHVKRGDTILVLESMKMEFEIRADVSGTLKQLNVAEGALVQAKAQLFEIESTESA